MKEHETGAVRSPDADRERWDLISPIGLRRLAETYHEGATKYAAFNWEKGFPVSDLLNHAIRHLYLYLSGDRSEDHLAHAGWNMLAAMHSEELWPHLNEGKLRGPGCTPPKQTDTRKRGEIVPMSIEEFDRLHANVTDSSDRRSSR